jgi:hypothetical protein
MDNADEFMNDNTASYSFMVTSNVFSKGRLDANKRPINYTFFGSGSASGGAYVFGNLLFVSKGGYQVNGTNFAVSKPVTEGTDLSTLSGPVNVFLFKWADGTNGGTQDDIIQSSELTVVGEGSKTFKSGDTSGTLFDIPLTNSAGQGSKAVLTEDNTWYLIAADFPSSPAFLGSDGQINYYPRSFFRKNATASFIEKLGGQFLTGGVSDFNPGTGSNQMRMFPFEAINQGEIDSVRYTMQKGGIVPALPLVMSTFPVNVNEVVATPSFFNVDLYPNPTSGVLNVSVKLQEKTDKVFYSVNDAMGRSVMAETRNNIKEDTYSFSTEKLAAGTYYFVTSANDNIKVTKFTVIK